MVRQDCEIKQIDEILDEAIMNAKPHYLIKWKNQPHQFDTWQPIDNLAHITTQLTKWIKQRRKYHSSNHNVFGTSTSNQFFTRQKKRKIIKKREQKPKHVPSNQVIVVDQECEDLSSENYISQSLTSNKNQTQKSQETKKAETKAYKLCQIKKIPENNQLNDDKLTKNREGMKIVGRVKSEDIIEIDSLFIWKGNRCFKIKLSTGKLTNMREEDLKLLCPQMLCDFYENNEIQF